MTISLALLLIGILTTAFFLYFACLSNRERELRAVRVSLILAGGSAAIFVGVLFLPTTFQWVFLALLITITLGAIINFTLPIGRVEVGPDIPSIRFDEREIMFARANLLPGSPEFESYYSLHPEHLKPDNSTRAKPGLFSPDSKFANMKLFASGIASFFLTGAMRQAVDGDAAEEQLPVEPAEMTEYVKELARYYGALDVGVTALQPAHIYSHIGRGAGEYGAPVELNTHAIAFTVEMDYDMVGTAPHAQISMESARQYVESGRVAVALAAALRAMGYHARAHIDGNYRVIAPLVARDAGLGEIGRMSLLMTPKQGPRVRIGVVTTDYPLIPDIREPDASVIDFCTLCKKCAEVCPSHSIPNDDRQMVDGALRWRINPDTCFRYWNVIGTDCGKCMAACPYSHPDNLAHNLVRLGIAKSGGFRRAALKMDDLFYGREPAARVPPDWTV